MSPSSSPAAPPGTLRARTGLGGSHTVVTYPPLNALETFAGEEPFKIDGASPVHLYFHVAFCEFICAFCHYRKTLTHPENQASSVLPYVEALGLEVDLRRDALAGAPVESVYLGGGTPTALHQSTLERLVGHMGRLTDLRKATFSFETSPKTAVGPDGAAKLRMLVQSGARRVSIGVQTFDEDILRRQRGHDGRVLQEALDAVFDLGISVNIDLIQDLPTQRQAHIDADLARIERLRPNQVTWYTLRAERGSAIGKREGASFRGALMNSVAGGRESIRRRLRIIEAMGSLGYRLQPGGRFLRDTAGTDIFKAVRNGLSANLLGFGVSAYSHGWGYFFRNVEDHRVNRAIGDYIARMQRRASPVGSAMRIDDLERASSRLVLAARSFIPYDLLQRDDESGQDWRRAADRCVENGLLERESGGLRLTRMGAALEEEVSSLFYSAPVRRKLELNGGYWANPAWFNSAKAPLGAI